MINTILFPFDITEDNRDTYIEVVKLAEMLHAKVVLYTSASQSALESEMDAIYFHFLEMNGHLMTEVNQWKKKISVPIKRVIKEGERVESFRQIAKEVQPDCIAYKKDSTFESMVLNSKITSIYLD